MGKYGQNLYALNTTELSKMLLILKGKNTNQIDPQQTTIIKKNLLLF